MNEEFTKEPDGIYTNLESACKGLPEWGDIYCYICRKEIKHDPNDGNINFFRFDAGKDIWYKFFHWTCYTPSNDKAKPTFSKGLY